MQQLTLDWNQRWNHGRASYRLPRETIRKTDYDVALTPDDTTARAFVVQHHYSRSVPAMRYRVGLYRHGRLVGVAIFSHPCSDEVLTNTFPVSPLEAVELGRFVLTDDEPGNAESFFLGRAFALIARQGIRGVVSFADPFPRTDLAGNSVLIGHTGTIYQAHNGIYLGRATPRTLHLLPDGRVLNDRGIQKIRRGERGWHAPAVQLQAFGLAAPPTWPEDRAVASPRPRHRDAARPAARLPQICMAPRPRFAPLATAIVALPKTSRHAAPNERQ